MSVLGQQPEPFHRARLAEDELNQFAEQADSGLLHGRGIPAFEDLDQPVRIA